MLRFLWFGNTKIYISGLMKLLRQNLRKNCIVRYIFILKHYAFSQMELDDAL